MSDDTPAKEAIRGLAASVLGNQALVDGVGYTVVAWYVNDEVNKLHAEVERLQEQRAKLAHDIRSAAQGPRLAAELLTEHSVPMVRAKATAIVRGLDRVLALVGPEADQGEKP